jgi:hypothetical protein
LHSPSATAVFLLNDQPLFTAFIGKDGSVSPKYNICYLSELYIPKSQVLDFNVKKSA